jgi:hypothetical protein
MLQCFRLLRRPRKATEAQLPAQQLSTVGRKPDAKTRQNPPPNQPDAASSNLPVTGIEPRSDLLPAQDPAPDLWQIAYDKLSETKRRDYSIVARTTEPEKPTNVGTASSVVTGRSRPCEPQPLDRDRERIYGGM